MTHESHDPRVAVIGGGIAGLAAAHRLVELNRERRQAVAVHLIEASDRLGGTIATERSEGFVIESGPDSFLAEKPAVLRLCERLGATQRLVGTREGFRRTYVVHAGRLHPLPEGFLLLAPTRFWPLITTPLFSWPGKLRMALDLVLPRGRHGGDESLGAFVSRRLGHQALERVAQPLVGGIYTADPDRLSLAATMPRFLEMEQQQRSIILAMWQQQRRAVRATGPTSGARWGLFVSFDDGMQSLVDLLAQQLPEGAVQLRTPIRSLQRSGATGWRVDDRGEYDGVVMATPAYITAQVVADLDDQLGAELRAIPYASSATVTLAYHREDIPHPLDGFGFVIPAIEGRGIIACTFSNLKYPGRAPAELILMRCFVGGALQPHLFEQEDAAMVASVRHELCELLGIRVEPLFSRVHRHPRAMPQYHVGHLDRIARIAERLGRLPGLRLAGSAYYGVGIPDCVRGGEEAAEAIMDLLRESG